MRWRKRNWLLVPILLLLAALPAAWFWLLHTEPGARWLFDRAAGSIPATLQASRISGDLGSGLRLDGLIYDDGAVRTEALTVLVTLDLDLLPPAAQLDPLSADGVSIHLRESGAPQDGDSEEIDLEGIIESLSLPVPVRLVGSVSRLAVDDTEGERLFEADAIEVTGTLHRSLVLENAALTLADHRVSASATLGLQAPWPLSADFGARGEYAFDGELEGSLESLAVELDARNPALRVEGTLGRLLDRPEWVLWVTAPRLQWPLEAGTPDVMLADVELASRGDPQAYEIELAAELAVQGLEPSALRLDGTGRDSGLSVRRLLLDGPELALAATGDLGWDEPLSVGLEATLQRLEAGRWVEGWPAEHPVQGAFDLYWSGRKLEVPRLRLSAEGTSFTAGGRAVYDLDSGVVDTELEWSGLTWPPGAAAPLVASDQGALQARGSPDDWTLAGELDLEAPGYPGGRLQLEGGGDRESMDIGILDGSLLGGSLTGRVGLNWTGPQPFEANLGMEKIHTEPLYPAAPAVLNADLTVSGTLNPLAFSAGFRRFDGTVMDHPMTLGGSVHFAAGEFRAEGLSLRSGTSVLALDGNPWDAGGLAFDTRVEDLSVFAADLAGSISGKGMLSLDPASPAVALAMSADRLRLGPLEIERIESRDPETTGVEGFEIVVTGLNMDRHELDTVTVRHAGRRPLQDVAVDAVSGDVHARLRLTGDVGDWADPLRSGWSGALSELLIERAASLSLSLEQPAALTWRPPGFALEPACLAGTGGARLCLETAGNGADDFEFAADLAALPVSLAETFLAGDFAFNQNLSGRVNWSQRSGQPGDGKVLFELSPGEIRLEEETLLQTGPGLFGFELRQGMVQQGRLDLSFPGLGVIDVDFNVPDLGPGPDSRIQGRALADFSDMSLVGLAFPVFDTTEGVLDVDLALTGTLADPALDGSIRFMDGHIEDSASGFSLRNIELAGEIDTTGRADLRGTFTAGEGDGAINVTALFDNFESPDIRLSLKGKSLTLVDVPDLKLVADPDIGLGWHAGEVEIAGRIDIPAVRFSPSYLPQASVRESDDVVIVAGERPGAEEDQDEAGDLRFKGELEVALGKSVRVDLDVAQIDVSGATRFDWRGDPVPIANGGFELNGEIQAFGQFLRLTRGRIGFPDIPADNPHLNIRAEREIFGNAQIRRAGLMIAGTLNRPIVEPYTVPMTNKERARTLLITGSDFDYEQGMGAVDFGMYVLPRLYVSYGIGVFEEGNVLKARFDLGRGFGIRATSGQRETGLDISYTLDR